MYNDLSAIADFEFIKTFYLRRKNLITEEDFQNTTFNLSKDIDRERLLKCELMEEINGQLCITSFGIRVVEYCAIICEDCGETVYFNIFSPRNTCPKCGKRFLAEYQMNLGNENYFKKYKDTIN